MIHWRGYCSEKNRSENIGKFGKLTSVISLEQYGGVHDYIAFFIQYHDFSNPERG
jgi:hypothetical protein